MMNGLGAMGHYGPQQPRQVADAPVTEPAKQAPGQRAHQAVNELREAGVELAPNTHGKFASALARGANIESLIASHMATPEVGETPEAETETVSTGITETEGEPEGGEDAEPAPVIDDADIVVDSGDFGEIDGLPEAEAGGLSDAEIAAMLLEEGVTIPV